MLLELPQVSHRSDGNATFVYFKFVIDVNGSHGSLEDIDICPKQEFFV